MIIHWTEWPPRKRPPRRRAVAGVAVALVAGFVWWATRPVTPPCANPVVLMGPSTYVSASGELTPAGEAYVRRRAEKARASGKCAPIHARWHDWLS
ncbi:hypothetical protein ACFRIC_00195 [Streptomyces sp. NPDC056738]|uniref:hypothetical protein n=1 Tax=Streptomyces sp. NPDC056738 TaxID=3345933 RepID=UPI003685984E